MSLLEQEMKTLARQAGGSHKTVHDRMALARRFCERLLGQNVQIRRVEQLKARHIESYVRERLEQGITKRSLQKEMAAIRCLLKQAGRDRLAASERLSNKSLGLTGAYSPHSLRYAWAQDAIRHYLAQGFSKKEALALTAMDLGHGDGRGRYVAQVYGR